MVEGASVGVHFIITADRRAAVPSALTSVVTTRLVLRMAERDDYPLLGVDAARIPSGAHACRPRLHSGLHGDSGGGSKSGDPVEERAALTAVLEEATRRFPVPSQRLGRMPGHVRRADLDSGATQMVLPFAIGDLEIKTVSLDLSEGHALVAGPSRSGRSSTLATLAVAALETPEPPLLALFLGRRSPLASWVSWDIGPVDANVPDDLSAAIADIRQRIVEGRTVLCFVDDVDTLPDSASAALEELARQARDLPVRFVAAADNRWALRAYGGLVPELRKSKRGVLLTPEVELDGDLLGIRLRAPFESLCRRRTRLPRPGRWLGADSSGPVSTSTTRSQLQRCNTTHGGAVLMNAGDGQNATAVRRQLVQLVATHGPGLLDDSRRVRAMLADAVAGATAEANLIGLALSSGVPDKLRDASRDPARAGLGRGGDHR